MTETSYSAAVAAPAIQALIISPDNTYEVRELDQDHKKVQAIIGGFVEVVEASPATFFVNEDATAQGLPFNPMATFLWWKLAPEMEALDELKGTVIVVGMADEAGDSNPLDAGVLDLFRQMEAIRLQRANEDQGSGEEHAP